MHNIHIIKRRAASANRWLRPETSANESPGLSTRASIGARVVLSGLADAFQIDKLETVGSEAYGET